jgi:sugar/nucleoside kinase (ribokinase family)
LPKEKLVDTNGAGACFFCVMISFLLSTLVCKSTADCLAVSNQIL